MSPIVVWILKLLRSPEARAIESQVISEVEKAVQKQLSPDDPPQPLSHADVEHQQRQMRSAAHAFPPPCPPSTPPTAPPGPPRPPRPSRK